MKELVNLGKFEVISNILRISDPCYNKSTWCAGTVKAALPGTWGAQVLKKDYKGDGDMRCRKLVAVHWTFNKHKVTIKKLKISVGVDSGCCGIFDNKFYQKNYKVKQALTGILEYEKRQCEWQCKTNDEIIKPWRERKEGFNNGEADKAMNDLVTRLEQSNKDYRDSFLNEKPEETKDWVEVVSDKTFTDVGAGVVDHGCVSRSGYGDGSYVAYAAYDREDRVVGVKILF